jgi:hypothetical protein
MWSCHASVSLVQLDLSRIRLRAVRLRLIFRSGGSRRRGARAVRYSRTAPGPQPADLTEFARWRFRFVPLILTDPADRSQRTMRIIPSVLIIGAVGFIALSFVFSKTSPRGIFGGASQEPPLPPASSAEDPSTAAAPPVDFYTTNFSSTENPISEGRIWVNGKSIGVDWQDVATVPGRAFGTQTGSSAGVYDDSSAILQGTFGPNQEASATVVNNDTGGDFNAEVELRLRSSLSPHSITGYEIEFRTRTGSSAYCDIVRWNGALGSFTPLLHLDGGQCGVATGDVVRARIVDTTISAYKNDTLVMQVSDDTFSSGNPGIGFFLFNRRASGNSVNFGFTSFTAQTLADGARTSTTSNP